MGLGENSIFLVDPRINGKNKMAREKAYKTKVNFISVGVNINGGFATGSINGEIRLYKEVGQIAKTLLPGLGEPILSLDASKDSKWLLATCQTYLLLIPTELDDDRNGYTHRMGKDKPTPTKLSIKPQHRTKYGMKTLNFRPAKFNNTEGREEVSIVASTQNFLIEWDFNKVQKGFFSCYRISKQKDNIVDNQFNIRQEDNVIVTMMSKINFAKRKPRAVE
jgi:hypothetical protein